MKGGIVIVIGLIVLLLIVFLTPKKISSPTSKPLTTREKLNNLCPLSISENRNGIIYINPTNGATRDNYLFSGCKESNTCDTTNLDPISKNLLEEVPKCHCGCWVLGKYSWDPPNNKWVKNN
jgi:hypothetical protein